jgi:hypothetical protein
MEPYQAISIFMGTNLIYLQQNQVSPQNVITFQVVRSEGVLMYYSEQQEPQRLASHRKNPYLSAQKLDISMLSLNSNTPLL